MNCADIKSARKLIAQFEGNALGRHNSAVDLRSNEVAERERPLESPRPFRGSTLGTVIDFKRSWEYCDIGEYCRILPGDADPRTDLRWKVVLDRVPDLIYHPDACDPKIHSINYWEFEAVRVVEGRGQNLGVGFVWRRIK